MQRILLAIVFGTFATCAQAAPPNIVYILADDFGYGDASCYNPRSKIQTPHIDRIAKEGMKFTDAHSPSAVCTPTRYGILTGRYSWRTRLKYRVLDGFDPPLIEPGRLTVGNLLQQHGYRTACVGKWHLGMHFTGKDGKLMPAVSIDRRTPPRAGKDVDYTKRITGGPIERGFDWYFGISASLNMSPFCYIENDRPVIIPTIDHPRVRTDFITVDEGIRSPDFTIYGVMPRLAGEAVRYLEKHAERHRDQPFFLYAPLSSPHLPVVTNEEYRGRSQAGLYGDFVVETDAFVGAILETLDRTELADNTLVIFTSDNGGLYHWWEAKETDDLRNYRIGGRAKQIQEFGHQGNAHLRGTKADIWEGGHRVPFVTRWPGRTPPGSTCEQLVELTDLLATSAAIVKAELPPNAGADSRNLLPLLLGQKQPVREYSIHHSLWGVFAVRQGDWKMIPHRGSGGFTRQRTLDPAKVGGPPGQLYNLKKDPSETRNLWNDHPEIVDRMKRLLAKVQAQ